MASIHLRRQHTMGLERARAAVNDLAAQLGRSLEINYQWEGNTLTFRRADARGRIAVTETDVTIDAELDGMLALFKGTVEKQVSGYLDQHVR